MSPPATSAVSCSFYRGPTSVTSHNDNKGRRSRKKRTLNFKNDLVCYVTAFLRSVCFHKLGGKSAVSLLLLMEAELSRIPCIFLHKVYSECEYFSNTTPDASKPMLCSSDSLRLKHCWGALKLLA